MSIKSSKTIFLMLGFIIALGSGSRYVLGTDSLALANTKTNPVASATPSPAPSKAPLEKKQTERKAGKMNVLVKTNKGEIRLELDKEKAPVTTQNFLSYAEAKFFDATIFHRVIGGFMIQGGGFDIDMKQKPTQKPIKIESNNGLKNDRGTIAMARTNDPNSATAQFFINLTDNSFLNYESDSKPGYAVFGKVTAGMEVVDEIAKTKTGNKGMHSDVPLTPVVIESVTVEN